MYRTVRYTGTGRTITLRYRAEKKEYIKENTYFTFYFCTVPDLNSSNASNVPYRTVPQRVRASKFVDFLEEYIDFYDVPSMNRRAAWHLHRSTTHPPQRWPGKLTQTRPQHSETNEPIWLALYPLEPHKGATKINNIETRFDVALYQTIWESTIVSRP